MHRAGAIILLLLICFPVLLAAQEDDDGWDFYDDGFSRGDQTFIITLGTVFPTIFRNQGNTIPHKIKPPIGGTGSLAYNYYLTPHFFLGAEASGMFLPTLAKNTVFIIPLGIRGGYQFNFRRFEFPINLTFGMVWHRYLNYRYYGIYLKGGASAFFRATYSWSFGINSNWYWFPEWTKEDGVRSKPKDVYGNFIDVTLSARYHF